LNEVTLEIIQ